MIHTLLQSFLFILAAKNVLAAKDLPDYFPRCYQNEKALSECLLRATETVRPFLKAGVPELNLKPLSPFVIPLVSIDPGTASLDYHAEARNMTIYGLDNYNFSRFNFDPDTLRFDIAVEIPSLYLEGELSIKGKLLSLQLGGSGLFRTNITQSRGSLNVQGYMIQKKSMRFLEYKEVKPHIIVGEVADYHVDGLFDDNPTLKKIIRQTIDDNIKILVEEFRPTVESIMGQLFKEYLLKSLTRIPYDRLYPVKDNKV